MPERKSPLVRSFYSSVASFVRLLQGLSSPTREEEEMVDDEKLRKQEFFHGFLPREDLRYLLKKQGDFLVRITQLETKPNRRPTFQPVISVVSAEVAADERVSPDQIVGLPPSSPLLRPPLWCKSNTAAINARRASASTPWRISSTST